MIHLKRLMYGFSFILALIVCFALPFLSLGFLCLCVLYWKIGLPLLLIIFSYILGDSVLHS